MRYVYLWWRNKEVWRVKYVGKKLRLAINLLGLGCLLSAAVVQVYIFSHIVLYGPLRVQENRPPILVLELFLSIFALVYVLFLFISLMRREIKE